MHTNTAAALADLEEHCMTIAITDAIVLEHYLNIADNLNRSYRC